MITKVEEEYKVVCQRTFAEEAGTEIAAIRTMVDEESGLEVGMLSSISQRFEMNVIKYGGQYQAARQGIYDIVEFNGTISSIKEIKSINKNVGKVLGDVYLASLGNEIIPTVDGMQTKLPIFTAELKIMFSEINVYGQNMVNELDDRIADFIGNQDTRQAFLQLSSTMSTATKFNADITSFIKRNINVDARETAKLSTIVGNNNEYVDSIANLATINELFSNKDLSKIEKKVETIEARFDILIKVLNDKEESMTKEALEALLYTLDTTSKFLTNLSAIYYLHVRCMDLAISIKKLIK